MQHFISMEEDNIREMESGLISREEYQEKSRKYREQIEELEKQMEETEK